MSLLKKIKKKWSQNKQEKAKQQLSPEMRAWGLEILLESLHNKVNPEYYDVKEIDGLFYIMERLEEKDEEDNIISTEWKKRFSDYYNGSKAGSFLTHEDAISAIEKHIEAAHKHFNEAYEQYVKIKGQ